MDNPVKPKGNRLYILDLTTEASYDKLSVNFKVVKAMKERFPQPTPITVTAIAIIIIRIAAPCVVGGG